ncbi:hypothetical protein GGQ80_000555 [Sphingomonas jinjuensis]|uniref:Uncharacterized protein n=1 Tax=Sphingomonas jinjuensis TaxID=535907 RepID=A0A840F4F1_9SPHN|nr:hypothetical protein [Sphingomonas jinjuensis]MBB4152679.1 hypothetical protein [Sphingomonas jinjuensis]
MRRTMAIVALGMIGAKAPPAERVVSGDALLRSRVGDVPATLRIDPAAPAMPLFDQAFAERARLKLKGKWGISIGYAVGPVSVMTRTQVVPLDLGAGADKRRIGWSSRPFSAAAEGSVGPDALPEPVVRFQLHSPRPDERTVALPMIRNTGPFGLFGNFSTTFAAIEVAGEPMRLRLDPFHPRTLATAGAAVRLAHVFDGTVSGEPRATEIFFGVKRPVRDLTLRRPFAIGPLAIVALGVRVADAGSAASIREAGAASFDPDEVVVTAKGKKRDIRRDTVSLGADYLARCSSIVFDKPAGLIRLSCN